MSLMRADFTTHDYAPHTHEEFVIAMTESGGAEIASGRIVERVCPSILFVSNPEERQSARMGASQRWLYRAFYMTVPAMKLIAHHSGRANVPYFTQSMFADPDLIGRFGRLHRVLEAENDPSAMDEALINAFGTLFDRYAGEATRPERAPRDRTLAKRIIDMMQAHYAQTLGLNELAIAAGLTNFQLIGLFKRTVGLTPHAYLTQVRLNAACDYLKRGHTAAESALAAGFCDQSALSKHFKRSYGITPLQFAAAIRAG